MLTSTKRGPANVVFHSEWDNFNQFLSGVHGSPMSNTAGGIMKQEVSDAAAQVELASTDWYSSSQHWYVRHYQTCMLRGRALW